MRHNLATEDGERTTHPLPKPTPPTSPDPATTDTTLDQLVQEALHERPTKTTLPKGEVLTRTLAALGVSAITVLISWHVTVRATQDVSQAWTAAYTIVVSLYVVSRFVFAAVYRPPHDYGITPDVAIVIPAYNEGAAVSRTIDACLALDYPRKRLEIVVVNDGSEDDTWEHMVRAQAAYPPGSVQCLDLGSNQGKRAAMAAGIRATTAEILLFVDSDSEPAPRALRQIVQSFADSEVGAVSGITHARNQNVNALTRMQAARYYVSFQLIKSAESVFSAVTCAPGCFSAYRREAILPLLPGWENQRFLGVACTYGDDRALTNRVIEAGWRTRYDSRAEAWTDVPENYRKFFRQQLRWKKSWSREGPLLLAHIWRSRPLAFPVVLVATLAGLASPVILAFNVVVHPGLTGTWPLLYVVALALVSMGYGLLHRTKTGDRNWVWAIFGTFFYVAFSPQLLWALLRIRDGSWGTRATS